MFFNDLKSKLYPKFHNLADSTAVWKPKLGLALFLGMVNFSRSSYVGKQSYFGIILSSKYWFVLLMLFFKMLACKKKTDSLLCIYKGETRHLLSFCVPCSSLSLWHPRYLVYWIHAVWISSKLQQAFKEIKPPNSELCFILQQLCALVPFVHLGGTNKMIWSWCKKKLQKENQLTWGPTLCWLWTLLFSWYF